MPDKQINEFPYSAPEDSDLLHTKKADGEDSNTTFEALALEILSRTTPPIAIKDTPTAANMQSADYFAIADNSNGLANGKVSLSHAASTIGWYLYPVGSYYFNYSNSTNPSTLLGFGTWVQIRGRVLVGEGEGTDVNAVNQTFTASTTGGEYQHQLTTAEMPIHSHGMPLYEPDVTGGSWPLNAGTPAGNPSGPPQNSNTAGSSNFHNNVQPYEVCYMWRRTA